MHAYHMSLTVPSLIAHMHAGCVGAAVAQPFDTMKASLQLSLKFVAGLAVG